MAIVESLPTLGDVLRDNGAIVQFSDHFPEFSGVAVDKLLTMHMDDLEIYATDDLGAIRLPAEVGELGSQDFAAVLLYLRDFVPLTN